MKSDKHKTVPSVKDPVCEMTLSPSTAVAEYEHGGRSYYFCSEECREQFVANPDGYPKGKGLHR